MQPLKQIPRNGTSQPPSASYWRMVAVLAVTLALLAAGSSTSAHADDDIKQQFESAGMEIKAAVANGEMSRADAWDAWIAARQEIISRAIESGTIASSDAAVYQQAINKEKLGGRLREAGGRLKAAVAKGEMTEGEAWTEWYATRDELIGGAVESGDISEDVAAEFRGDIHQAELKERISAAGERIKAAVVSGEMSEDEGWDEWHAAREELIDEAVDAGEVTEEVAAEFRRGYERWAVGQRLKTAVARGEMTEEEAWAAWAQYNNETEQLAAKIEELVERGELAPEEAEEKLRSIEQALDKEALDEKTKTGSLNTRTVLRAIRRVDLSRDQKDSIRKIEREALRAYRELSRKDKQAHHKLAEQVKAEIAKLLDDKQTEQFETALERLDSTHRRGKTAPRRQDK